MSGKIFRTLCCLAALSLALFAGSARAQKQQPGRTPTETVQQFYRALHDKRFREAFALSIYRPAVEPLSEAELTELSTDFGRIAAAIPADFLVTGEQISGDAATVFVKINQNAESPIEPVFLMLTSSGWIIGDKENASVVKKGGKDFFFKARVETHHVEVEEMMQRIHLIQVAYAQQHKGEYADLPTLIEKGYLPKDLEGTETTGYRFGLAVAQNKKSFVATAEPASYGRSGRLSYAMDQSGMVRSKDVKGKPLAAGK